MTNEKKYVSLERLQTFKDNIDENFASKVDVEELLKQKLDKSQYVVDDTLSSTSANPIQNKVINTELDAIADAMGALDLAIDGKANEIHSHELSDISGLSELQADWSINDETDPAYIQNRPFYSADNVTIYESTITTSDIDGMYGFIDQSDVAKTAPALIEGETYTITFDNDVYTCVCYYGVYLGNLSLLQYGENTNEPFAVAAQEGVAMCIATADTVSATHTIKIEGPVVKTLDAKYLPHLPYVTMQEGNQYWVTKNAFAQTNSNLTYKGKSYMTNHEYFLFFLTNEGIWQISLVINSSAQIPSASNFRMNYASSDGTLSFYWRNESETTEITTTMYAYLYDVNTGNIIRRESDVQSVTIGAYTKKSHNVDFYINKSNPQDAEIIRSFDDYIEVYSQSEVDALIADIPTPDMSNYYTKSEIDSLELITVTDIDTICGSTIQSAEDVMF